MLLANSADANVKQWNKHTPLHMAMSDGVAQVLLEYSADLNAWDNYNQTLLHAVMKWVSTEAGQVLLKHGVDVNAQDNKN